MTLPPLATTDRSRDLRDLAPAATQGAILVRRSPANHPRFQAASDEVPDLGHPPSPLDFAATAARAAAQSCRTGVEAARSLGATR